MFAAIQRDPVPFETDNADDEDEEEEDLDESEDEDDSEEDNHDNDDDDELFDEEEDNLEFLVDQFDDEEADEDAENPWDDVAVFVPDTFDKASQLIRVAFAFGTIMIAVALIIPMWAGKTVLFLFYYVSPASVTDSVFMATCYPVIALMIGYAVPVTLLVRASRIKGLRQNNPIVWGILISLLSIVKVQASFIYPS
jgi:hypothetical protein